MNFLLFGEFWGGQDARVGQDARELRWFLIALLFTNTLNLLFCYLAYKLKY